MKTLRRFSRGLSVLAIMGALLDVSPVHAVDGKIYPATMCVTQFSNLVQYVDGEARNTSDAWALFNCPIVRDTPNGIRYVWIRVIDQNPSLNVGCLVLNHARNDNGTWGWFSPTAFSVGSSPGTQHLWFTDIGGSLTEHAFISCWLPPSSGISSYYMDEYE